MITKTESKLYSKIPARAQLVGLCLNKYGFKHPAKEEMRPTEIFIRNEFNLISKN